MSALINSRMESVSGYLMKLKIDIDVYNATTKCLISYFKHISSTYKMSFSCIANGFIDMITLDNYGPSLVNIICLSCFAMKNVLLRVRKGLPLWFVINLVYLKLF